MTLLRAAFFGTPEFAVPTLERLAAGGAEVVLAVTQPDRAAGRHKALLPSPVAEAAGARGIPVEKPERLRGNDAFSERLRAARPDVAVVVAYGRLLPDALLEIPRLGYVNVHASLLPRHRGASPVQAALLAGDEETGVSTMRIVPELDAGPVYLERRIPVGDGETAGELSVRLAAMGADLLVETLAGLEAGELVAHPQSGEPTWSRPIRREEGAANWSLPADELARRLRAFTPWPGLFTFLGGERIKILPPVTAAGPLDVAADGAGPADGDGQPGSFRLVNGGLSVAAGGGSSLSVGRLQREGRKPVSAREFLSGVKGPARFEASP